MDGMGAKKRRERIADKMEGKKRVAEKGKEESKEEESKRRVRDRVVQRNGRGEEGEAKQKGIQEKSGGKGSKVEGGKKYCEKTNTSHDKENLSRQKQLLFMNIF